MSKHTPGPWRAEDRDGEYSIVGRPTWPCNRFGEDGEWDVAVVQDLSQDDGSEAETKANAHLIAAAPELLDAATDALAGWRYIRQHHGDLYGVGWDRVERLLQAAIAKAEGRAS